MAGLTAARELSAAGIDTIVLEARDRVGGRVHTIYDQRIELRSNWELNSFTAIHPRSSISHERPDSLFVKPKATPGFWTAMANSLRRATSRREA